MFLAREWKAEAVVRLLVGIFICIFAGGVVSGALRFEPRPADPSVVWRFYGVSVLALGFLGAALVLLHRPWTLETFKRQSIWLVVICYVGLMLSLLPGRWAGKASGIGIPEMVLATLSFQGAAVVLITLFLRFHQTGWREAFGFDVAPARALTLGFLVILAFLPLAWGMQMVSGLVLERLGYDPQEQIAVQALRLSSSVPLRLALGAVSIVLAPVAEEALFRGIFYPAIKRLGYPRLAWIGTSVLFAAIHLNVLTFLPLLVLALGLVMLYERTGNLLAPIAAHACFNALNFALLFWIEHQMA
jgi:membrane protease YdiL (CAAX protease family)